MALAKQKNIKWLFLLMIAIWGVLWGFLGVPLLFKYLIQHPETPIPLAFAVHQLGYILSLYLATLIFIRKPVSSFRFALGIMCLAIAYEITVPPLCVATDGILLITADNPSCMMGNDSLMAWGLNLVGIHYGTPLLYYATYIGGVMLFAVLAVLLLKKKELWQELTKGIVGF